MRIPRVAGHLLCFDRLDNPHVDFPVYALGWRLTDNGEEYLTRRLLRFKYGSVPEAKGVARIIRSELPGVLKRHCALSERIGIVAALSSKDTGFNPDSPVCAVAKHIAKVNSLQWLGEELSKAKHTSLHTIGGAAERDKEISNKYNDFPKVDVHTIVILDDFVTRGSTFAEIARAIRVNNPKMKFIGMVCGKNERARWARSCGHPIDNGHMPDSWKAHWEQ